MLDVKNLFETDLPRAFAAHPEKAAALDASFAITVTGVGSWLVFCERGYRPAVHALVDWNGDATVSITLREEAFQQLASSTSKQYTAMQLYMGGKLSVDGPLAVAMRLEKLLGLLEPEKLAQRP